jgi:hypothetical protein
MESIILYYTICVLITMGKELKDYSEEKKELNLSYIIGLIFIFIISPILVPFSFGYKNL